MAEEATNADQTQDAQQPHGGQDPADWEAKYREAAWYPPATQVAFGACPFCKHGVIRGVPRAHMGECRSCGAQVNRTYVADRLLDRLAKSEKKGTPKQLSRECVKAGIRLPASAIRT